MDNITFLNAIRASASVDYKGRVPTATQTNITDDNTATV